jgi:uncharacterized protein YbaR (Trm112 family)
MPFDFDSLRDLVKCLRCGANLKQDEDCLVCENEECRQVYPIHDDIPRLLVENEEEESANF